MTTTVTEATKQFILSNSFGVSTSVGLIAILLLVALMVRQELLRAYGGPRARIGVEVAKGFIVSLLLAFVVIVILRFAHILYPDRF
jgi:uncharacterized PurR-regulated membrane protein YhhQ (DUF165 family)